MRISQVISLAEEYLELGIIVALIFTTAFLLGYFFVYKKILKGTKKLKKTTVLWLIVFLCYLVIVIGATFLSRGNQWGNSTIRPLFYSYKETMRSFEARQWRFLILNILMFVPFGFLLPLGLRWAQTFWKTYLTGFLATVFIEIMQTVLKKGIFDLDDIFNNTVGTMIGFGCYTVLMLIISLMKHKKIYVKHVILAQLPLLFMGIMITGIFISYSVKDLGYMFEPYIITDDDTKQQSASDIVENTMSNQLTVYKTKRYSSEEAKQMAVEFFGYFGDEVDESRADLYDDTAVFYGVNGSLFWMDYPGGTYKCSDYETGFGSEYENTIAGMTEEEVRNELIKYNIALPNDMTFSSDDEGNYTFTAENAIIDGYLYTGRYTCKYYEKGLGDLQNNIIKWERYKDFDVITTEEAYMMIQENENRLINKGDELILLTERPEIEYMIDTKGYYQPVYVFREELNGDQVKVYVPAIE